MVGQTPPVPTGKRASAASRRHWRVLLVEDDDSQAELVRRAFELDPLGMDLIVAPTLREARRLIAEMAPDLIVTDVKLPGASGLDLLHDVPRPTAPIIVMTSYGDEKMAVEAIKAGALDYVAKSPAALADIPRVAGRAIREWRNSQDKECAERALREAEERERIILDSIPTGLITTDLTSGRIVQANRAALLMIGLDLDQVLDTPIRERVSPEPALLPDGHVVPVGDDDIFLTRADGTAIPVMRSSAHITLNDRPHRVDSIVDITDRKRTEEQTAMLGAAVTETADAVIITDADRLVQYVNPAFERITGYSANEVVGRSIDAFHSDQDTESDGEVDLMVHELNGPLRTPLSNLRKDGSPYQAEVVVSPIHNDAGVIVNYVSVMRDVTRETALEMQLRHSQKMEAIGQLAGGVAHDFNNLLYVIINSAYFLQDTVGDDPQQRADLEGIISAANRAAGLTRQLLTFSKRQPLTPVVTDLNGLVTGLEKMLLRLLGEDIQIVLDLDEEACSAKVDRGQIEQVIVNLAVNARDAMVGGGTLTIQTSRTTVDRTMLARFVEPADMSAGQYVMISVSDTGTGISAEHLPHVFEPFYTTKEPERGTGLGLATVYGICKRHGGQIALTSKVGVGTTIGICLPEHHMQTSDRPVEDDQHGQMPGGDETILLAEDDPYVRKLGVRILSTLGYNVIAAENGEQALAKALDYSDTPQLLLTDVVMPGMNGFVLSERIRELVPTVKVLFVSGYPSDRFDKNIDLSLLTPMLAKPYRPRQLAETIRAILDGCPVE